MTTTQITPILVHGLTKQFGRIRAVIINQGRLRFAGPLDDLGDLEASFLRLTDTHNSR